LKKRNSPSPFGVRNKKAPRKKGTGFPPFGESPRGMRVGRVSCFLVIIVMLVTAAILTLSAADRSVGAAWGSLSDSKAAGEFILPSSGFIVVEMSNVLLDENGYELEMEADSLFALRGRKGEPGLLPLRNEITASTKKKTDAAEKPVQKRDADAAQLKDASSRADASLPMTDFSWSLSEYFSTEFSASSISLGKAETASSEGGFQFPDRLVERKGQLGGSGLFTTFGVSRMKEFHPRLSHGFAPGESSFSTANGALFADSAVSRLFSFKSSSGNGVENPASDLSDASDFEAVVLSVGDDGKSLAAEEGDDAEEAEDVTLARVSVLWKEHIVKSGETLSDIAVAHGVPMSDIIKANELKNANRLSEKQILLVPNSGAAVEATLEEVLTRKARLVAAREKVLPIKITAYVVAEGDSLWSIANSQNLEIDTLFGCNDLRNPNMIRPGATLRIPNQDGIFHKVKSGETLAGVAKKYGIAADRIREANGDAALNPFTAGKEIFLPGARPEAVESSASSSSSRSGASSSKSSSAKVSGSSSRSYRWPVVGKINSPFGWRRHPVTRRRDFHTGIDIKAPRGRTIQAARGGRVEYSGWMGGYGRVVVIDHGDGYSTLYAHCTSLSVRKGQSVSQGQAIATVGTTGRTTGPHLHFEVRRGNNPVNPLGMLR